MTQWLPHDSAKPLSQLIWAIELLIRVCMVMRYMNMQSLLWPTFVLLPLNGAVTLFRTMRYFLIEFQHFVKSFFFFSIQGQITLRHVWANKMLLYDRFPTISKKRIVSFSLIKLTWISFFSHYTFSIVNSLLSLLLTQCFFEYFAFSFLETNETGRFLFRNDTCKLNETGSSHCKWDQKIDQNLTRLQSYIRVQNCVQKR